MFYKKSKIDIMTKKFKDETFYYDAAKSKMLEMIVERINEVTRLQKQTQDSFSENMDESLKSSNYALMAALAMELSFLNKLLLVR